MQAIHKTLEHKNILFTASQQESLRKKYSVKGRLETKDLK